MKKITYLLLVSLIGLASCDDFLTPRDKSQILEERLFTNREGVEEAMYGLYTDLGRPTLYGGELPILIDMFGQYLNPEIREEDQAASENIFLHKHDLKDTKSKYSTIWQSTYKSIGYINNVIKNLDIYAGRPLKYMDLYRGECLGLRAFLHFDLLRMFGSPNLNKRGIPYVVEYGVLVTPFLSTAATYDKVIADLKEAERLLAEDENLLTYPRLKEDAYMPFTSYRTAHFNLYAAQATLARVYWTRNQPGDLDSAAHYARKVIESKKFPLPNADDETLNSLYFTQMMAGTIADNEGIFGLYNNSRFDVLNSYYVKLKGSFLPNELDLYMDRSLGDDLRNVWIRMPKFASSSQNDQYKVPRFLKLIDGSKLNEADESGKGVGVQGSNQIRIPEMYLILAESLLEKDPNEAVKYFNELTASRQLKPMAANDLTPEVLDREFQKEYACEGQYWFRLRRRQVEKLPLASHFKDENGNDYLIMNEDRWTLTIPDEEFEYRDESTYKNF